MKRIRILLLAWLFIVTQIILSAGPFIKNQIAFADAAVPASASTNGNYAINGDGTITLTVDGAWAWQSHGNKDCNLDRYAVGWAVDWNDSTEPGNFVGTLNGDTFDTGVRVVAGGLNSVDNDVHYYSTPPRCGVLDPTLHYPVGNWGPLSHTYPAGTTSFKSCVVTYDIHNDGTDPKASDLVAGDPNSSTSGTTGNKDNSIEGNTPDNSGCFTANIQNLIVVKHVINNNGGNKTASNFAMHVSAVTPSQTNFQGSESGTTVQVGVGAYSVSETTDPAYAETVGAGCSGSIAAGETKICTITNDDIQQTGTIELKKAWSGTPGQTTLNIGSTIGGAEVASQQTGANGAAPLTTGKKTVNIGTYYTSESALADYTTALACFNDADDNGVNNGEAAVTPGANDSIAVSSGQHVICTYTNTRNTGSLKVNKLLDNNGDGTFETTNPASFNWSLDGSGTNAMGSTVNSINTGSHNVNENSVSGYHFVGWYLTADTQHSCANPTATTLPVSVSVTNNATADVTLCNARDTGAVSFLKIVNGGNALPSDWLFTVSGGNGTAKSGDTKTYPTGSYTVTEAGPLDYTLTNATGVCSLSNNIITLLVDLIGGTCTITNTRDTGTLKVIKHVVNDNGGKAQAGDFSVHVKQTGTDVNGSPAAGSETGTVYTLNTGTYLVSEDTPVTGYQQTSIVCDGQTTDSVTVTTNTQKVCTITNDDVQPKITVTKDVHNNHGGTAVAGDFPLFVGATSVTTGVQKGIDAGSYTVSETQQSGYSQTSITGDCAADGSITLNPGDIKACTVTNEDIAPTLTVNKQVLNPFGNPLLPSDFPLFVDSTQVTSGAANTQFNAGNHTISETQQTGYSFTGISGDCTMNNNIISIMLSLAGFYTCTLTNTAIQPQLIVIKHVINDNSGSETAKDFTMTVSGNSQSVSNFAGAESPGTTIGLNEGSYSVDELPDAGYTKSLSADCSGTISIGETKTCTVTNNDVAHPAIHVVKSGPLLAYEGDTVIYTFTVTNPGDTVLSGTTVDDSIAGAGVYQSGDGNNDGNLDQSETWIYTKQYTIPTPQIADVTNTVTACAFDPAQTKVCDTDDHQLDVIHPNIHVVKSGPGTAHEGDTVTYTFTVTNTGDIALSSTTVNDNLAGAATFQSGDTNHDNKLDTNETWIFTADYVIPAGQTVDVVNTATACGYDPIQAAKQAGAVATCDTDDHTLDVLHPSLNVVKTGPSTASPGQTITYTFTVTNTGDTPLDSLSVNDSVAGSGATLQSGDTNHDGKLDLTETWVYTVDYQIPTNQSSNIDNIVTVCGDDILDHQACDSDTHHLIVLATLIVTKYNDLNQNGTQDQGEPSLPDWEILLDGAKQTTGADGTTTFTNVLPGFHSLDETLQTGWHQSHIHCDDGDSDDVGNFQGNGYILFAEPGATVNCNIGNFHDVVLNLTKSNNKPNPTEDGDTVTYTLVVSLPNDSGEGFDTTVTDLPPKNFTYVPGSWTAESNYRGDLKPEITPEPNYGSPGTWHLGNLLPGEIVILTYLAKIGASVSNGLYPDLAFAQTCGHTFVGTCNQIVYSNRSLSASPFVGTKVSVTSPQVLGASTTILVNTGTNMLLPYSLSAISLLLSGLWIATRRRAIVKGGSK